MNTAEVGSWQLVQSRSERISSMFEYGSSCKEPFQIQFKTSLKRGSERESLQVILKVEA